MNKPEEYFLAVHEAGHLVADLFFFANKIKSVSILPDDLSLGRMETTLDLKVFDRLELGSFTPNDERYLKKFFITGMSGPAAEAKARRLKNLSMTISTDYSKSFDLTIRIFQNERVATAYLNYIIEESRYFINQKGNWKLIKYYANELVTRKNIGKKKIIELYNEFRVSNPYLKPL